MKNPSYQDICISDFCTSSFENNNSPPENDEVELSYEKIEAEVKEVCNIFLSSIFEHIIVCHSLVLVTGLSLILYCRINLHFNLFMLIPIL